MGFREEETPLQLSFVLPATLQEKGTRFQNGEAWRTSPDNEVFFRTRMLLISFLRWYDQTALAEFLIVCPDPDIPAFTELLHSLTSDPRYKVVAEFDLCPEVEPAVSGKLSAVSGWHIQQLLKLCCSARIRSPYYVTLDHDVLAMKPTGYGNFVQDGRALINIETPDDYRRLYCAQFAEAEIAIKSIRYGMSAKILGYQRPRDLQSRFFGETPVTLHTESVQRLIESLCTRHNRSWIDVLAKNLGWTEYGLYFQFLEKEGELDDICKLGSCNTVLDLDRSVWQESSRYREPRNYSAQGWFAARQERSGGLFVAIQSWLPASSWLPAEYPTVRDFYRGLEESLSHA